MKRVDQTVFGVPGGNCFSACVASILELEVDAVPYFMGRTPDEYLHDGSWWDRFTAFLDGHGWRAWMCIPGDNVPRDVWPDEPYILTGRSPRDTPETRAQLVSLGAPEGQALLHSVVAVYGEVVHDPHPSRAGVLTQDDFVLIRRVA